MSKVEQSTSPQFSESAVGANTDVPIPPRTAIVIAEEQPRRVAVFMNASCKAIDCPVPHPGGRSPRVDHPDVSVATHRYGRGDRNARSWTRATLTFAGNEL
jgi:hypothetical protein